MSLREEKSSQAIFSVLGSVVGSVIGITVLEHEFALDALVVGHEPHLFFRETAIDPDFTFGDPLVPVAVASLGEVRVVGVADMESIDQIDFPPMWTITTCVLFPWFVHGNYPLGHTTFRKSHLSWHAFFVSKQVWVSDCRVSVL
jgi:hypothetical protein